VKHIATWIRECDEANFARAFAPYPDVHLWNARTETVPWEQMDALLLTGGSDISEGFLRQPVPDPKLVEGPDPARDKWEFAHLAQALNQRLPVLAVCRGLQVLNVARGGTLHLDIPHHDSAKNENVQELRYVDGASIRFEKVNSSHHQALDQLGSGLVVEARCAADGVIEQARLENYPFGQGVQYHPERDPLYQPLFDAFVHEIKQAKP
jgi:gamma-glutamyl-gamma-aminobutyrate hydrolase PuuD